MIWQRGEDFRRRKRNVEEVADPVLMPAIAQRLRERHQMIVVHPDDIVGPQQLVELAGEILVDANIAGQIAARELGEIEPIMQNRP